MLDFCVVPVRSISVHAFCMTCIARKANQEGYNVRARMGTGSPSMQGGTKPHHVGQNIVFPRESFSM